MVKHKKPLNSAMPLCELRLSITSITVSSMANEMQNKPAVTIQMQLLLKDDRWSKKKINDLRSISSCAFYPAMSI